MDACKLLNLANTTEKFNRTFCFPTIYTAHSLSCSMDCLKLLAVMILTVTDTENFKHMWKLIASQIKK